MIISLSSSFIPANAIINCVSSDGKKLNIKDIVYQVISSYDGCKLLKFEIIELLPDYRIRIKLIDDSLNNKKIEQVVVAKTVTIDPMILLQNHIATAKFEIDIKWPKILKELEGLAKSIDPTYNIDVSVGDAQNVEI